MDGLLRWGLANSDPATLSNPPVPRQDLDPGIIDMILGKPDSVQMKEQLTVATDRTRSEEDRVTALDNFEMLIESIDNANDITSMKMWEPLLDLLNDPSEDIQTNSLWIIGTALQNNPKAQAAFLQHDPLPKLLHFVRPETILPSAQTRSKAVYTLSGALKHNRPAVIQLEKLGGWKVLTDALTDSDVAVRRKVAFLLNALLIGDGDGLESAPTDSYTTDIAREGLEKAGTVHTLVTGLVDPPPTGPNGDANEGGDPDFEEKAARTLLTFFEVGGTASPPLVKPLHDVMVKSGKDEGWGLTKDEWKSLLERTSH